MHSTLDMQRVVELKRNRYGNVATKFGHGKMLFFNTLDKNETLINRDLNILRPSIFIDTENTSAVTLDHLTP